MERYEPLDGPLHGVVSDNHWRSNVKDLMAESAPGVEDSSVECTGERALSVGAESVMHDSLLGLRACSITGQSIAPHFRDPFIHSIQIRSRVLDVFSPCSPN